MRKGTKIRRCPVCGVHTATMIPTGRTGLLGEQIVTMTFTDCCHKPVCEIPHRNRHDPVPRSQFPLPGYFCDDCFKRIGRESNERAAAAQKGTM